MKPSTTGRFGVATLSAVLLACTPPVEGAPDDAGTTAPRRDAGVNDGGGSLDAGALDAGALDAGPDDLSSLLVPFRVDAGLPALAAAVLRGDRVIALGATGVRKLGDPTLATVDDEWHLGSDTKAMTATLVGLAVEEGKLHFEDTVVQLFAGETVHAGWGQATLEDLLRHRAGAPDNPPGPVWSQLWADGDSPDATLRAVRSMLAVAPPNPRGGYLYSNAGYMMAGAALEKAYGVRWEVLIQSRLFGPLGMTGCGFGAAGSATSVDQPWAHGSTPPYTPVPPGPAADNPRGLGPAGTVHCSLRAWARFLSAHLAGGRGVDGLLKAATMARLHTPPPGGDYASGWISVMRSWAGGPALTHAGSNTMNYAVVWLAPANDLGYLVVTNIATPRTSSAVDDVVGALIGRYPR